MRNAKKSKEQTHSQGSDEERKQGVLLGLRGDCAVCQSQEVL